MSPFTYGDLRLYLLKFSRATSLSGGAICIQEAAQQEVRTETRGFEGVRAITTGVSQPGTAPCESSHFFPLALLLFAFLVLFSHLLLSCVFVLRFLLPLFVE